MASALFASNAMNDGDPAAALTLSFKALQRARSTIEDFSKSYFPYLGLELPGDFFKFLDVLVWVEGAIYQLDEDNEQLTARGAVDEAHAAAGIGRIRAVLQAEGLVDERIDQELQQGLRYWSQEQSICRRLLAAPRPLEAAAGLTAEEVLECHEAKSFDYRVLFLLLCQLSRTPYDEPLLSFLRLDEMLVDISDDLVDYEDDVLANSFNIFRCYIHLYGRDAGLKLAERISWLEGQHRALLDRLAPPLQQHYWRRHEEACEGQGSDRWVFPPPIYDEEAFRQRVKAEEAADTEAAREAAPATQGAGWPVPQPAAQVEEAAPEGEEEAPLDGAAGREVLGAAVVQVEGCGGGQQGVAQAAAAAAAAAAAVAARDVG